MESIYAAMTQKDGSEMYLVDRVVRSEEGSIGKSISTGEDEEKEALLNRMLLEQLLATLSEGERELIRMRYFQDKTQTQIATVLGVSQVQVSRLEKKILGRLRERV